MTGSNSSMLSSEFSTALGGRTIELKVHPFDFNEYLALKGFNIKDDFDFVRQETVLKSELNKYLTYGGLPETINKNKDEIFFYLKNILDKVLNDDIVRRFRIRKFIKLILSQKRG